MALELSEKTKNRISSLSSLLMNLWFSTCRITIVGRGYHHRHILGNGKIVGATWHRGAIFLVWFFRKVHPMIMFSKSNDGDLIAGYAEKLGVITARGSSSRGGRSAFVKMLKYLRLPGRRKVATVLDGPRGPRCVAKEGMIALAMQSRVPLLPIAISANRAITLKGTWDKTLIPLPFSRVVVMYRAPLYLDKKRDFEHMDAIRLQVETTLNDMVREVDQITGYTP